MDSNDYKSFCDSLNSILEEQTFEMELCPRSNNENDSLKARCRQLSLSQLKDLIKTITDSPLTQGLFNGIATDIFKQNLITNYSETVTLNVIDKLLFLIETRINSISSTISYINSDDETATIDLNNIKRDIVKTIRENTECFAEQTFIFEKLSLTVEVPSLTTEKQLDTEVYDNLELDPNDPTQLRSFIGEAFVYEISKYVKVLEINSDKKIIFSEISFEDRLNLIKSLPVSLVQSVINYVEKQKTLIDKCLIFEGFYVAIDNTFFTLK